MTPQLATALTIARRVGIVLLFVVILLRPGFGRAEVETQVSDLDVVVVIDRTRSMAALDYQGHEARISGAKADLATLAKDLPGARFGMLAFGTDARILLPLTTDADAFDASLDTLYLEGPKDGVGSRVDRPVPELKAMLERAAAKDPQRHRVIVFVSDGEDTDSGGTDQSYADVADLISGGVVFGYGTTKGAPMPQDDNAALGYVQDPATGGDAISKADPDNLRKVADELGVSYRHRTAPGGLAAVAKSFRSAWTTGAGDSRPVAHDLTWVAGIGLLALLLIELHAGWQALWASRRTLTAPRSRTGGDR